MTLQNFTYGVFFISYFSPSHLHPAPKAGELAIKRQPLIHPSSGSENVTCGHVAEMDGGAWLAVYIAREEPSIFKRLMWWSEQKTRQVSLLIWNRKPQSLQLWYTSHFPLALDFLSTLVIPPFLFVIYLIMSSWSKSYFVTAEQSSQPFLLLKSPKEILSA